MRERGYRRVQHCRSPMAGISGVWITCLISQNCLAHCSLVEIYRGMERVVRELQLRVILSGRALWESLSKEALGCGSRCGMCGSYSRLNVHQA